MVTHGHPVTSGIPASIMDYFISWDLAELPNEEKAQSFYTEELLLVRSKTAAWEYYEPRTKGEASIILGKAPFSQFTRDNLDFIPNNEMAKLSSRDGLTWYFCSQAAFKYHVTFDKILGKIQTKDPNAILILMKLDDDAYGALHEKVIKRLVRQGDVDLDRVVFIPRMSHYQLMAMYKLSDVVLDSVYFGGDTTTREAFEVGSPVITLPGKTIGQRWTQAYYRVMGIKDFIAKTANEYVQIAVKVANASDKQKSKTRARIKKAAHKKLFKNKDAPVLWGNTIMSALRKPKRWHWSDAEPLRRRDEL
jgi:predicted O-linked N-acetylglucosamine transferase (SPINDLY family)